ncbi:Alpha-mannosidase I MNS4-like protein [Drosera capensis]
MFLAIVRSFPAYLLFGDEEYLLIFQEAYQAAMRHLFADPWHVLAGDVDPAIRTHDEFFSVWKRYGFTPEGFNLATLSVQF